ncbi:hypothetical protein ACFSR6_03410 [Pedobacter vanadiisoli]|uniref:Uncharacterized protein n=1 Tax=Pedobacter vanadiisoli TaxID=1761975 RepID=A0ABW5MEH7_9SPHI
MTNKEKFLSGYSFQVNDDPEVFYFIKGKRIIGWLKTNNLPSYCIVSYVDDHGFDVESIFLGTAVVSRIEFEDLNFKP